MYGEKQFIFKETNREKIGTFVRLFIFNCVIQITNTSKLYSQLPFKASWIRMYFQLISIKIPSKLLGSHMELLYPSTATYEREKSFSSKEKCQLNDSDYL